jgi:hypothetical protein
LKWQNVWHFYSTQNIQKLHIIIYVSCPPKNQAVRKIKYICKHLLTVFHLTQPSNKQIISFGFEKQNNAPSMELQDWIGNPALS